MVLTSCLTSRDGKRAIATEGRVQVSPSLTPKEKYELKVLFFILCAEAQKTLEEKVLP